MNYIELEPDKRGQFKPTRRHIILIKDVKINPRIGEIGLLEYIPILLLVRKWDGSDMTITLDG